MIDKLDAAIGEMSTTIREIFRSTESGLMDQLAATEKERDKLQNENVELKKMYNELSEKYVRVKRGLHKILQRKRGDHDIDQMATIFMESSSTFEDAARAAMRARSIAKKFKTASNVKDTLKQNKKQIPVSRKAVPSSLSESNSDQDPHLSPQLGNPGSANCFSTKNSSPRFLYERSAEAKPLQGMPGKNVLKKADENERKPNEFNTLRCGVDPSELKGHAYSCCKEFYEHVGIDNATSHNCKSLIEAVSRHRSSRPMPNTPEGFWNIQLPETQNHQ